MVVTDTDRILRAAALNEDFLLNQDVVVVPELLRLSTCRPRASVRDETKPPPPGLVDRETWGTVRSTDQGTDKFWKTRLEWSHNSAIERPRGRLHRKQRVKTGQNTIFATSFQ